MKEVELNYDTLHQLMKYDPDTGLWTRLVYRSPNARIGQLAGAIRKDGRVVVRINGSDYLGSRLAWLYMTGQWPKHFIDHIDHDPSNDRWVNLREATDQQNKYNAGKQKRNKSGYKGVCWHQSANKWMAQIRYDNKHHYLGVFDTPEEAHEAYKSAAACFHGEFGRTE